MTIHVHAALGGGGMNAPVHAGFISRARELGVVFTAYEGVSAGAIAAAFAAQAEYELMEQIALAAMVPDVHRLKTGPELVEEAGRFRWGWPPVDIAVNRIQSLGRNDRLFTNYLQRHLRAEAVQVPCWVGATNWRTGEYRSIGHLEGEWSRAVWASATMPLIWEPVLWQGARYVDGGIRTSIPVDDALRHIMDGAARQPDLVVGVGLAPDAVEPFDSGVLGGVLHVLNMLTHQVARDDVTPKSWWPRGAGAPAVEVRRVPAVAAGTLEATRATQRARFAQGVAIAEGLFS